MFFCDCIVYNDAQCYVVLILLCTKYRLFIYVHFYFYLIITIDNKNYLTLPDSGYFRQLTIRGGGGL